ncbi:MAG: ATP-dependent DNA ligase [Verrucomicrobiota bacterium]
MPTLPITWKRGIYLPEPDLWLDAHGGQGLSFVSHAHADHVANHRHIVCSVPTAHLLRERFGFKAEMTALEFGQPWEHAGHRIVLTPAGHVLGSAMIHLTRLSDGQSLLYTGDFKLRRGLTAEPARPLPADTVIMECTFGQPHYQFPPLVKVQADIHRWCRDALDHGTVPVLLGYSLGKAQEIQALLAGGDFRIAVHPAVAEMNGAYRELGVELPPWTKYEGRDAEGKVLVFPPNTVRSTLLRKIKNKITAMVSGWAINAGARFSWQVDEAFPLSDHADWPELLELISLTNPKTILATHGNSAEFAAALRRRGLNAWSLGGNDQMELSLNLDAEDADVSDGVMSREGNAALQEENMKGEIRPDGELPAAAFSGAAPELTAAAAAASPGDGPFGEFCAAGEAAGAAAGRLRKIALLAEYFRSLADEGTLAAAVRFLSGRPAGTRAELQAMGTGWAVIRFSLLEATGHNARKYREISRTQNDAGRTAWLLLQDRTEPRPWTLEEVQHLFDRLRLARGPSGKTALLTDAFRRLSARSGEYVVKILTGDTRLGLKEGLLEDAIAEAFAQPAEAVREAHMLSGDLGETARRARDGTLAATAMRLFQPVRVMLASPEETAAAVWERLVPQVRGLPGSAEDTIQPEGADPSRNPETAPAADSAGSLWLEDKFDGIRAQLHHSAGRTEIYSRDLRGMEREFPDILNAAAGFMDEVVLDGEIIARAGDRTLTFFDLQKRLGRREADLFLTGDVPLVFVVFDLLWLNGRSLLREPLHERRRLLENLALPAGFERIGVRRVHSAAEVQAEFQASKARGNEGLIAKDPASLYAAGRRGKTWLKLKTSSLSLDVVVVAAEQGHGKRSHVLSDYTFAVRDENTGALKTIGKAYSGLTDVEIEELTAHFRERTIEDSGHRRTVIPDLVLEVAFDSIQASKRHDSGLALRFPRIKAIRRDKTPAEIDTLQTARQMAASLADARSSK